MIQLTRCHFWQKVARYLPKKLLYYAYIKVVAEMTSGKFARVNVNDMKTMDVLKMFEDHHKLGHKYEKCWCHKIKVWTGGGRGDAASDLGCTSRLKGRL